MEKGEIPPMPAKPPSLLPSDDSMKSGDSGQSDTKSVGDQPGAGSQQVQPPPVFGAAQVQGTGQIVIRYPNGKEEIIDVLNIDSVRRVAKAGQVLRSPLSSSYPETAQPHPPSTSSLPAVLQHDDTEAEETVTPVDFGTPDPTEEETVTPVDFSKVESTKKRKKSSDPKRKTSSKESSDDQKKKKGKPQGKYQSESAPTTIGQYVPPKKADQKKLLSTPVVRY